MPKSRFVALKEFKGKDARGRKVGWECYADPVSGEVVHPRGPDGERMGWTGNPPDEPSGSVYKEGTERVDRNAYRLGWERVFGVKETQHG